MLANLRAAERRGQPDDAPVSERVTYGRALLVFALDVEHQLLEPLLARGPSGVDGDKHHVHVVLAQHCGELRKNVLVMRPAMPGEVLM